MTRSALPQAALATLVPLVLVPLVLVPLVLGSGCTSRREPARDQRTLPTDAAPTDTAATRAKPTHVRCATLATPSGAVPPTLSLNGVTLTAKGPRLVHRGSGAGSNEAKTRATPLRLGVLADTREASAATVTAVKAIMAAFVRAKVHAVILLGGIDATFEGLRRILGPMNAGVPLLAMPGDLSSHEGFQAALRELGTRAVDLTAYGAIELPGATLAAVPGYYRRHHIAAGPQGCSYDPKDLDQLATALSRRSLPRILLSYGPPHGRGAHAVDRAYGGTNIGDKALTQLMHKAGVRFGVFAHVCESGTHATDLHSRPIAENSWSDSLLVNVGTADAVPCQSLDGSWQGSSAVIFEVSKRKARYRRISVARPPTPPGAVPR